MGLVEGQETPLQGLAFRNSLAHRSASSGALEVVFNQQSSCLGRTSRTTTLPQAQRYQFHFPPPYLNRLPGKMLSETVVGPTSSKTPPFGICRRPSHHSARIPPLERFFRRTWRRDGCLQTSSLRLTRGGRVPARRGGACRRGQAAEDLGFAGDTCHVNVADVDADACWTTWQVGTLWTLLVARREAPKEHLWHLWKSHAGGFGTFMAVSSAAACASEEVMGADPVVGAGVGGFAGSMAWMSLQGANPMFHTRTLRAAALCGGVCAALQAIQPGFGVW